MQKVLGRAKAAERQAGRRLQKQIKQLEAGKSWANKQEQQRFNRHNAQLIKTARHNRREDWELGPIAPKRDAGEHADNYGSFPFWNFQLPEIDASRRPKWVHITEGDRVVVVKGREKGKIGVVSNTNEERVSVTLRDIRKVDVAVPGWIHEENEGEPTPFTSINQAIPLDHVRLVYPLPDPVTGVHRDVVIERLVPVNRQWNKAERKHDNGERCIPGTNTIIPWPEKVDELFEDHPVDTLRIHVEEETFRPYLLYSPMPHTVLDELRNKYSRFRTRHDYEYREKLEAQAANEDKRKDLMKGMRTPLQELADVRAQRKAEQEKDLSDEQLAKIGGVIAQEQAKAIRGLES